MLKMKAVLRYHTLILNQSFRAGGVPVKCIKYRHGEYESFRRALQDLIISGMVRVIQSNPEEVIKRIA